MNRVWDRARRSNVVQSHCKSAQSSCILIDVNNIVVDHWTLLTLQSKRAGFWNSSSVKSVWWGWCNGENSGDTKRDNSWCFWNSESQKENSLFAETWMTFLCYFLSCISLLFTFSKWIQLMFRGELSLAPSLSISIISASVHNNLCISLLFVSLSLSLFCCIVETGATEWLHYVG